VTTRDPAVSTTENPNDRVRRHILRYFYDRNAQATSQRGKSGASVKIMDARRDLKTAHGLTQHQVVANLNYLRDKGWINELEIQKTVRVSGGTVPSSVTWYSISAAGIDHIEGASEFTASPRFAGINIQATGQGVITLGDGNVVNVKHSDLHRELEHLRSAVVASAGVSDKTKLDVVANVETVKAQLVRQSPDRSVVSKMWSAIEASVTLSEFSELMQKVTQLIAPLLL